MSSSIARPPFVSDLELQRQLHGRTWALEREIEMLKSQQMTLVAQANHDPLTGLPNRKLLQDRFACAQERARRDAECFAILMVDLNDFKIINDTHGHAAGDTVLTTTAKRLTKVLRTCDTAARLGGDEFVLVLEGIHSADEVAQISRKIQRALLQPIILENWSQVQVSASIGMAMYPDNGRSLASLLQAADKAMYACKTSRPMELA